MNFDLYEFLKYHNGSKFYPVKVEEIDELEKKLNLIVPKELKDLLLGIGYGFIKGSENNVNRIMDTDSIRDFRLRKGDFEKIVNVIKNKCGENTSGTLIYVADILFLLICVVALATATYNPFIYFRF